jgi:hypothetical protein
MNTLLTFLSKQYRILRGFFPEAVPTGLTEFNTWADDIISTYNLPTKERDSIRFALATMVLHMGPMAAYRSKFHFVLMIRTGAAKQVAGAIFTEIKTKQAEATAKAVANGQST